MTKREQVRRPAVCSMASGDRKVSLLRGWRVCGCFGVGGVVLSHACVILSTSREHNMTRIEQILTARLTILKRLGKDRRNVEVRYIEDRLARIAAA